MLERNFDGETQDTENHRYAYNFDFDIMHDFLIRSFEPFFSEGSLLELGSFKGNFTSRLIGKFDDITCVEASASALSEAKARLGGQFTAVNADIESVTLTKRFSNIVLTHVLEHLDNPIKVLSKINKEWLTDDGRLFIACPNANAPSRQIAVNMGLISHNCAVTKAEEAHGHRRTYSFDTLESEVVESGLQVIHRTGVFFKALSNFQWDKLLETEVISKEYLEGCYKLGQKYPDLCSSIVLICRKNDL